MVAQAVVRSHWLARLRSRREAARWRAAWALLLPWWVLLILATPPGCALARYAGAGGDEPKWQEHAYRGVSTSDVLRLAQTAFDKDFPAQRVDAYHNIYESRWVYGNFSALTHQAVRQRVVVETEPTEEHMLVRLRVQCEVNDAAGRMADERDPDWVKGEDDVSKAGILMKRLHLLLKTVALPEPPAEKASG